MIAMSYRLAQLKSQRKNNHQCLLSKIRKRIKALQETEKKTEEGKEADINQPTGQSTVASMRGGSNNGHSTLQILAAVGLRIIQGKDWFIPFGSRMMTSLQKCADGLGVAHQTFKVAVAEMMEGGVIDGIMETAAWKQMKFPHVPKKCESPLPSKSPYFLCSWIPSSAV